MCEIINSNRPTSFLKHARKVSSEDVRNFNLEMMPGFSLKWHYTSTSNMDIKPNRRYSSYPTTKAFEMFVRMFKMKMQSEIESALRKVTVKNEYWLQRYALDKPCKNGIYDTNQEQVIKLFQDALKIKNVQNFNLQNMTNNELKVPAALFLKLIICPQHFKPWFSFFSDLFQKESADHIVLSLNRILKNTNSMQTNDLKAIANKLLERLTTLYSLKYLKLLNMNHTDYHKGDYNSEEMEGKYNIFNIIYVFSIILLLTDFLK